MTPNLRHRIGLAAITIAVAVSAVGGPQAVQALFEGDHECAGSRQLPRAEKLAELRSATRCLLNRERALHGLGRLAADARLEHAAQLHSRDMGRRNFYAHDSPDGVGFADRIYAAGVPRVGMAVAENIHWGIGARARPTQIVEDWMNSPGHRANILNPGLKSVGIGIAFDAPELVPGNAAVYTTDFAGAIGAAG